jgi:uncharacterized protein YndB with AHSA1/START domain
MNSSKPSLVLKRRLKAPPETVYQAWTHPEQMTQWWGNPHHKTKKPIAETDLRVGGRFRVQFWGQDDEHHSVSGVYREVVPNRRLAFSWAWQSTPERESQVTIDLTPINDDTMLTLTHEQFYDQKACDSHRIGWESFFDNLEKVLA